MMESLIQVLQTFTAVPDSEIKKAQQIFRPLSLQKGTNYVQAGDIPQTLGFVVNGLLRLFYIDEEGNEFNKSFCMENSFVAAYSSLLLQEPSRLFIETLEDTHLLVATHTDYVTLTDGHICWQIVNRKLAESLFIKKEKRESELLLDDATTRYLTFLAEYPGLEKRLKQYHIASYLGITPIALSRIRTKLKK